ncbi:MAG: hypothetical protein ACYCO0_02415 [Candidatus Micrarchaeaceae archaeon]
MARTQVREQTAFTELKGNAVSLFISTQVGDKDASFKLLAKNGLRALTYQEALSLPAQQLNQLKGKWFYLDGKGINENGIYTFNDKGELSKANGNESVDKKVRVWSGNQPLALNVLSDYDARGDGRRFDLNGGSWRNIVAPVVVGVKQAQAGSVAATQKNEELARLLRVGEGQSIVLTYPNGMKTETRVPEGTTVHIE